MTRNIRLVIFDLDGTLTPIESLWRYLHDSLGTWEKGRVASMRYEQGELSYKEWAELDAACWAGTSIEKMSRILENIPYHRGVETVFRCLRERGLKTAIVSAGLSLLAEKAAKDLGADMAVSNELHMNDGALTGEITVKVAVREKGQVMQQIADQLMIPLSEVALVGDQVFDLPHSECLRIAFKPKDDRARQNADFVIEDADLTRILQYLPVLSQASVSNELQE